MSITVSTDVVCDCCGAWIHGTTDLEKGAKEARRIARLYGWKRQRNKYKQLEDLCNDCKV